MHTSIKLASILTMMVICSPGYAETIERIAAVAGTEIITMNDVRVEGRLKYAIHGRDISMIDESANREEELEKLVKELVQTRLISKQAKKNNINIGDREVDMQLQQMYQQSGQGEEAYKAMIAQEGMEWAAYRAYIRDEIEAQYVIRSELAGQVSPSEADVIACAQERAPDAEKSITVVLRQIIIPELEGDSSAGLSAPAAKTLNSVWWNSLDNTMKRYASGIQGIAARHPEKFVEYVKLYSTGRSAEREGVLGSFSPGDLSKDFAPVFTLQAGEVAPLITTGAGYHILKVDEVTFGESETWKKTVEHCREQITMRESQRLVESWLNDLMEKNYVSIMINHDISE
ncbi:MAG: SurA N-terminal domain-containing protein [Proteobacteria bacterium]|nr:SurA N-terminal domain-containing protein [Pseudomonadota bacterium]